MDIETLVRMTYLVEADTTGHTPYFIKRCVYAVAKKSGGDREALDKAFAICVAQAQKRGDLKKGSMVPTKAGDAASETKKKEKSSFGFTMDKFDQMLAKAHQKKESRGDSLVRVYCELHEELQIEQHVDEGGVRKAVQRTADELKALEAAVESQSLVAIPGILANLLASTLGRAGIMGMLGARMLLTAVDINPASFGQDLKALALHFAKPLPHEIPWMQLKAKSKEALGQLKLITQGELTPERVISILGDFFLKMWALLRLIVKGIPEVRAKNAALVLQYDMQEISDGLTLLAGTAQE